MKTVTTLELVHARKYLVTHKKITCDLPGYAIFKMICVNIKKELQMSSWTAVNVFILTFGSKPQNRALEAAEEISKLQAGDPEAVHAELDNLLCKVLKYEGYTELVKLYNKQEKWYG